jgi:hypothetical protein
MKNRWIARLGASGVLLATAAVPVASADATVGHASVQVSLDAPTNFDGSPVTFTTLGDGLCPSGGVQDLAPTTSGQGRRLVFEIGKLFTCDDGSGTWTLHLTATVEPCDAFDSGTWEFKSGTGAYRHLRGGGQIVGLYEPPNACEATAVVDHYRGVARFGD